VSEMESRADRVSKSAVVRKGVHPLTAGSRRLYYSDLR
jgi:hypothetical protein